MKTKPMKRNLLLLAGLFIVIFTGCKKEKIIVKEVERDFRWKAHPVFQYENAIIMNSFSTDSCILFRGTNYTTIVGSNAANNGGSYDSIFGNYFLKSSRSFYHFDSIEEAPGRTKKTINQAGNHLQELCLLQRC